MNIHNFWLWKNVALDTASQILTLDIDSEVTEQGKDYS